jgi:hypothetical protein
MDPHPNAMIFCASLQKLLLAGGGLPEPPAKLHPEELPRRDVRLVRRPVPRSPRCPSSASSRSCREGGGRIRSQEDLAHRLCGEHFPTGRPRQARATACRTTSCRSSRTLSGSARAASTNSGSILSSISSSERRPSNTSTACSPLGMSFPPPRLPAGRAEPRPPGRRVGGRASSVTLYGLLRASLKYEPAPTPRVAKGTPPRASYDAGPGAPLPDGGARPI